MKVKLVVLIVGFLVLLPVTLADSDTDTILVNISVQSSTQISIMQDSLTWSDVTPGGTGGIKVIDVKNIGSNNITGIYGYVDTIEDEASNPIGSDDSQDYAGGGVLTLRRNESGAEHYFAGRLEWNYTDSIELASLPTDAVSWGWFRNTSSEYVWSIAYPEDINSTNGCNTSGTVLRINKYNDNGTAMTRNVESDTYSDAASWVEGTEDWGIFDGTGTWSDYCVATYRDCSKVYVYKFDRRNSGNTDFDACSNVAFLNTTESIGPNQIQKVNLDTWMPYGMPAGNLLQATLTIYAED